MNETDCPICFDRPGQPCSIPAWVPNGDGTYTRHRQRSVYSDHDDRPCPWQEQDHKERREALLRGTYDPT
jgi:hypothetical protein